MWIGRRGKIWYTDRWRYAMSDFAYAYFTTELEKLDIPSLEGIFEKVQELLEKKRASQ